MLYVGTPFVVYKKSHIFIAKFLYMKKLILLGVLAAMIFSGCKKPVSPTEEDTKNMEDLVVSETFNWNTVQNIHFTIGTDQAKVITILSTDGSIVFHKGFFNQLAEYYEVDINLPKTVEMVLVNGVQVPVTGTSILVDLNPVDTKSVRQLAGFPTDGLLALWHFDENSGTIAEDAQGGFDGTINGAGWTSGISHSGLAFNAIDGGVTIPANTALNLTGDEISLTFWFKMNEIAEAGCFLFHNTKYILYIDGNGKVSFAIYNPEYHSVVTDWSDRILDTDWHFVAATYDGTAMKLYIDNQLMKSSDQTGNLNSRLTEIHMGNQSSYRFLDGLMDEVAIYNRAITVDEINTMYTTIPNPDTGDANMVSWWPMNEFGGTAVPDAQGNNNGTQSNATWATGVSGNCLSFDGVSSNVNIPNNPTLDFTNELTIMAWANTRDYKEAKIAQKGDWDGHGIGGTKWTGWKGHVRLEESGSESIEWTEGRPLLNEWYHVAITYDGTTLKLYVNGQLNNSRIIPGTLHINTRAASIGSDNGAQKFFNGLIDEVKFFNVALNQTEIQAAYNNQTVATDTDGDGIQDADDDFPNDPARAFINNFPAAGFGSLAFEDLWPGKGDYDFNDLVVDYSFEIITNASNKVSDVISKTVVRAIGAGFNNGYGFQFANDQIQANDLFVTGYSIEGNVVTLDANGLESGQAIPTVIVFDNAKNILQSASGFVNVEQDAPYVEPDTVEVNLVFTPGIYEIADLDLVNFNPFIFINGIRGKEVHLPDYTPTSLADATFFGTSDDDSNPAIGRYYKTANNLPWAINIAQSYDYTIEKSEITSGYLHFGDWAESSGGIYPDWYKDLAGYRNDAHIYQVPVGK